MSLFQIDTAEEADERKPAFFLAKELKRRGYTFQYVVRRGSLLHQKAREEGLPIFSLKVKSQSKASSLFRLYLAMKIKGCRLVDVHDDRLVALGLRAASLAKVPLRVVSRRQKESMEDDNILRQKYTHQVDAIVVASEGMKKWLIEGGIPSQLIQVIPDGIDFSPYIDETSKGYLRSEFAFGPDDFLVGVVAQLVDEKGLKDLIFVIKHLKEQAPKIKLIILGEGRMDFQQSSRTKEIEGEVFFFCMGFQKHLSQIIHSLDAFVLSSSQKNMSRILLDAMACRLPVIVTKSEGIAKVVSEGKTGLVVPSGRPKSIVQAILKIYEDQKMADQMGRRGNDFICQKFSMEAMSSKIINLYEDLAHVKRINLQRVIKVLDRSLME